MIEHYKRDTVMGVDVYGWPEFKAFCDRLGLDCGAPTTHLTIVIPIDGPVVITQEYLGDKKFHDRRSREVSQRASQQPDSPNDP